MFYIKLQLNNSVEMIAEKNQNPQPHLVFHGDDGSGTYYLKIEKNLFILGENSLHAFKILFECFFVFNLSYHKTLELFFNFIDYGFFDGKEIIKKPKLDELKRDFMSKKNLLQK